MNKFTLSNFFQIRRSPARVGPVLTVFFDPNRRKQFKCKNCGAFCINQHGFETARSVSEGRAPSVWTDHAGELDLIFSEKVIGDLERIKTSGWEKYDLPVDRIESEALNQKAKPNYYIINVTGRIDINRQYYDGGDGLVCEECKVWRPREGGKVRYGEKMIIPDLQQWDGSDFVICRNIRHGGFFCTSKIVELARVNGWTGFEFRGMAPRLPSVNLFNNDWLTEFKKAVCAQYPELS